jgi:hypothetical protein
VEGNDERIYVRIIHLEKVIEERILNNRDKLKKSIEKF